MHVVRRNRYRSPSFNSSLNYPVTGEKADVFPVHSQLLREPVVFCRLTATALVPATPNIPVSVGHIVLGCGRVPLLKYALRAAIVHVDRPDCEVCPVEFCCRTTDPAKPADMLWAFCIGVAGS